MTLVGSTAGIRTTSSLQAGRGGAGLDPILTARSPEPLRTGAGEGGDAVQTSPSVQADQFPATSTLVDIDLTASPSEAARTVALEGSNCIHAGPAVHAERRRLTTPTILIVVRVPVRPLT